MHDLNGNCNSLKRKELNMFFNMNLIVLSSSNREFASGRCNISKNNQDIYIYIYIYIYIVIDGTFLVRDI